MPLGEVIDRSPNANPAAPSSSNSGLFAVPPPPIIVNDSTSTTTEGPPYHGVGSSAGRTTDGGGSGPGSWARASHWHTCGTADKKNKAPFRLITQPPSTP